MSSAKCLILGRRDLILDNEIVGSEDDLAVMLSTFIFFKAEVLPLSQVSYFSNQVGSYLLSKYLLFFLLMHLVLLELHFVP